MGGRFFLLVILILSCALCGCVAYHPMPVDPPQLEQNFRGRTLTNPGLIAYVNSVRNEPSPWPPEVLDLQDLTLVALYYSSGVRLAQAQLQVAEAQIVAAGAPLNPSLYGEQGYNTNPQSRNLFTAIPYLYFELGGKRGKRVLQAQHAADAAQLAVAEAAWQTWSLVRDALSDHLLAIRQRDLLRREEDLRNEIVAMYGLRLAVGEAARPELDTYRVDLVTTQAALQVAEGEVHRTFAVLANATGVPLSALNGTAVAWSQLENPPEVDDLPLDRVQKAGLTHRIDIRRLLAEYRSADAALRVQVAQQYPNVQIGPGYVLEEGFARYIFPGNITNLPVFHQNQGNIRAAESQRAHVQAQIEAAQVTAIGAMEIALTQYRAATLEWREATARLRMIQTDREDAAVKALEAGEGDRLAVATARLQSVTAERARLNALTRVQTALSALDDSVQQPLEPGLVFPDLLPTSGSLP